MTVVTLNIPAMLQTRREKDGGNTSTRNIIRIDSFYYVEIVRQDMKKSGLKPNPLNGQSEQTRDVVAAVGFLYSHALPEWLSERLADLPDSDLERLQHLLEIRRAAGLREAADA